jgi:hypothetical protein
MIGHRPLATAPVTDPVARRALTFKMIGRAQRGAAHDADPAANRALALKWLVSLRVKFTASGPGTTSNSYVEAYIKGDDRRYFPV